MLAIGRGVSLRPLVGFVSAYLAIKFRRSRIRRNLEL